MSIDEFKGNAAGEKYQTIVTAPLKEKILDILPNRYEMDLIKYFRQFSSRTGLKYFLIDMNDHFRRVGQSCFPNAKIVADRFHVLRQVYWAMENVRKKEQKNLSDHYRKYFKRSKYLLWKNIEDLTDKQKERLALMLEIAPELAKAYNLKNKFRIVMESKDPFTGKKALGDWLFLAEVSGIPEFENCITAYHNWFAEIVNSFEVPYSNSYTEGCNNKTKVIKRVSFGIRNFNRLKTRILLANS